MDEIKGLYINLEEETERNKALCQKIKSSNINYKFTRYSAIKGDADEARDRGLSPGELGIWKTWLEILKKETDNTNRNYKFLHIVEDDARFGEKLGKTTRLLTKYPTEHDIIMTDMYVNPSLYKVYSSFCYELIDTDYVRVLDSIYSGCLSSCLIHANKVNKIYDALNNKFLSERFLKPLDNCVRNLMLSGQLRIGVTVPFLTTVEVSCISQSTIQKVQNPNIVKTQEFCTILRQCMSTLKTNNHRVSLLEKLIELLSKNTVMIQQDLHELTIDDIIMVAEKTNALQYKYRQNLIGDQNNEQNQD